MKRECSFETEKVTIINNSEFQNMMYFEQGNKLNDKLNYRGTGTSGVGKFWKNLSRKGDGNK